MKKYSKRKTEENLMVSEIARRRKEYNENEIYRAMVEKEYIDNPKNIKYSEGFYVVGKGRVYTKGQLLFPVKIIDGRKMFGKLQCLVTPVCPSENSFFNSPLGKRWVDRDSLILSHDHAFKQYECCLIKEGDEET